MFFKFPIKFYFYFQEGAQVTVSLRSTGEAGPNSPQYTQFLNIVLHQCMQAMDLKEIKRNYFNPAVRLKLSTFWEVLIDIL
jgi:hypothetical protein